ncbi:MAG: hypothetical protein GXP16_16555 [Gammaproteobacteria bacterium]|nr:hypothetical protein [Gammaproteobacteria bacterium]
MSAWLEINDWQLSGRTANNEVLCNDIAAALLRSNELVFGEAAWQNSRTHPLNFNARYLSNLSPDPVSGDLGTAKNSADLIYHHLRGLDIKEAPITLAVAGHVSNQQLGLLLGICQEAGLQVNGFVDIALAHCLTTPLPEQFHVLDLELYRSSLSHMQIENDLLKMKQCTTTDGIGVVSIIDGWMNVVADEFVQQSRFDPLHTGASEQQVFDQIYQWLGSRELAHCRISVLNGDTQRDQEVSIRTLQAKLAQRFAALDLSQVSTLAVTARVQQIPGLMEILQKQVSHLVALKGDDVSDNYLSLARNLDNSNIRRIDTAARVAQKWASPGKTTTAQTSHLLIDHTALPLNDKIFINHINCDQAQIRSSQVCVNGELARVGHVIAIGDRIEVDGQKYLAIQVKDHRG